MQNTSNTPEQLALRIGANYSGPNLEEFIIRMCSPSLDDEVLDIGCGSGKQLKIIAPLVKSILGVDVSTNLLEVIEAAGKPKNATLFAANMDDIPALLSQRFSLIYSSYALYYSANVGTLIEKIASRLLNESGRFMCVAPDMGNNAAWFRDLQNLFPLPEDILQSEKMSRLQILPAILDNFKTTTCVRFENTVTFQSIDDLMKYYDGCGAYCLPHLRDEARQYFLKKIADDGPYKMQKCALGIVAKQ